MSLHETAGRRIVELFATRLDYPRPGLSAAAAEGEALAARVHPEAAPLLREFGRAVAAIPPGRLEEIYTGTFDLDASCHPYAGYHLFGESYKRSLFLLGLKERYRAYDFSAGNEVPDHVVVLLRFLARCDDAELRGELVHEALLPTVERMIGPDEAATPADEESEPPPPTGGLTVYRPVLQALRLVLQEEAHRVADLEAEVHS